jgi:hypothetical protein
MLNLKTDSFINPLKTANKSVIMHVKRVITYEKKPLLKA